MTENKPQEAIDHVLAKAMRDAVEHLDRDVQRVADEEPPEWAPTGFSSEWREYTNRTYALLNSEVLIRHRQKSSEPHGTPDLILGYEEGPALPCTDAAWRILVERFPALLAEARDAALMKAQELVLEDCSDALKAAFKQNNGEGP